ncbi:MAG TPA: MerR family transcriptional regulator [Thermoanaerobaculia bacterium]|nr:MerR family transcriptional regulator [Thermoanaerobaculia bacterium]
MPPEQKEKKSYKIGEVCRMAEVQPYVLRYWETEFPPLAPNKSGGGQRLYSQREVEIVLRIKQLLYSEGFTIAGAKKKLDVELKSGTAETATVAVDKTPGPPESVPPEPIGAEPDVRLRKTLENVRGELKELLTFLRR